MPFINHHTGAIVALLTSLTWTGLAHSADQPDYDKEARWVTQVEDGLMDGDAVMIPGGDLGGKHTFLGLLTEAETDTKQLAIVVHGSGVHPDWMGVIQPLRVSLTSEGFHTLSIQMPVLPNGTDGKEYQGLFGHADQRFAAAVAYAKAEGYEPSLLVAHSLGTIMSSHYLANNDHPFQRFVAVGMGSRATEYLKHIKIPLLDLYGQDDLKSVIDSAAERQKASAHNTGYQQRQIPGDHFFSGKDDELSVAVADWLS